MTGLPNFYFRDIPAYVMDEIIAGMIDGKPGPTHEELDEWLASELEREAEVLLASCYGRQRAGVPPALFSFARMD